MLSIQKIEEPVDFIKSQLRGFAQLFSVVVCY
jgi:hypothetical protein